ncbi:malonate decarboxylase acyl carrier protein [Rhodoferax sp.]|jgi:malonate decarboxylase delta subunit|uniref:malonate decarboxylase acyl carrier protein n=2 Tax=Rhodoferax sp. TaxID=50421 RepID=UPI002730B98B|nr:malonate decarboxylase acyl carrier protein [Rhodoferax sp.]MDP1528892.1 malonate decarboxylase acyl carrier protein [Rhodoferax sp.]MDP1943578.1 malonate decarboxylase acyl carrier protein [Rhodoferax sp.]MDP2440985.1 malonate decarboxylase acyl carrier protein [Rhodoferax sp.]MDZ4207700.1 malonate decarboxylase acyl carrier protein [Rhodoferax sp.]
MEKLHYEFAGQRAPGHFAPVLVGVVGSGNLEVMIEPKPQSAACQIDITTSARGFAPIWQAVANDFQARHSLAGVAVSINDMGATPAVVSLRLDQAAAALPTASSVIEGDLL